MRVRGHVHPRGLPHSAQNGPAATPGLPLPAGPGKARRASVLRSERRGVGFTIRSIVVGGAPVALGGPGDVVGSFNDIRFSFVAANADWTF